MEVEIKLTELGHGSDAGTFTAWLKAVGDRVEEGEAVAEVMTEKANVEIPSPATGVLSAQFIQADQSIEQDMTIGTVRTA